MKRWWVTFALLLSVGFNLGLLAAVAGGWWATRNAAAPAEAPPSTVEVVTRDDRTAGEIGVPLADEVRVEPAAPEPSPQPPPEPPREEPARVAQAEGEPPPPPPRDEPLADDFEGEPPPRGDGPGGRASAERPAGPPLDRLADHLGLEGETRSRFIELQRRLFEAQIESRLRRGRLGREMRRELLAAEPDRGRIEALIEEIGETYVDAEKATAETILDTRRLLTPEQQRRYLHVLERLRGGGPGGPGAGPQARRPGPGQRRRPPPGS